MNNIIFIKLYKNPIVTPQPIQSININAIAHYNIEEGMYLDSRTNTTLFKIYIYFNDDPTGMHYKAQGFITQDDLNKMGDR